MDVAKRHEFALGTVINQGIFNLPSDISASLLQEEGGGDLNVSFGFVSFQRKKSKVPNAYIRFTKYEEKVISD